MMHKLDGLLSNNKQEDVGYLQSQVKAHLDRPFIAVQEYIPGNTLHQLSPQRAERCFDQQSDSQDRLITLGRLLAADMFCNNTDRLPCGALFDSTKPLGNSTNLQFEVLLDDKVTTESTFLDTANNADINFGDAYAIDNKQYSIALTDKLKVEAMAAYKAGIEKRMESLFEDISYLRKGQVAVTEYGYPSVKEVVEAVRETC